MFIKMNDIAIFPSNGVESLSWKSLAPSLKAPHFFTISGFEPFASSFQ